MAPEIVQLNLKYRLVRDGDDWKLDQITPSGTLPIDRWTGNRRSLMRKLEQFNIHPSREAEEKLAAMPERAAFGPDRD